MAVLISQYVLCCLLFSAAVVQAQYAEVVYRADLRPPEDVFVNGFPALGNNHNLDDHVTGASCQKGQDNTAFVDTTSNYQEAELWVEALHLSVMLVNPKKNVDTPVYIYTIHTNQGFYDLASSLQESYKITSHLVYLDDYKQLQSLQLNRWFAYNGIPASLIQGVNEYRHDIMSFWGKEKMKKREFEENQNRISEKFYANPNPYHYNYEALTTHHSFRNQLPSVSMTACVHLKWYITRSDDYLRNIQP